jgi:hypothetical protein
MNNRSFGDLMVGVLAYVSLTGFVALIGPPGDRRRRADDRRWSLPVKRVRRRVREDACRHCSGTGRRDDRTLVACRPCRGTGLQPRDASLLPRLTELWNGA